MTKRPALILLLLALPTAGCGQQLDRIMDKLAGHETTSVVLASEATVIDSNGISLRSSAPLRAVGKSSSVCLVLRTGVPLSPQPVMDKVYAEALHGATFTASLKMKSGEVFGLAQPDQAWSRYGHLAAGDEVSACFSCPCNQPCVIGAQVVEVTVASSAPLRVLGAYWESTNAFDAIKGN